MGSQERILSSAQRGAIEAAGASRNALLEAQDHLFAALGRPQPGRERKWAMKVREDLVTARECLARYTAEVDGPDGLYVQFERDAPWLLPRVRQLRNQLDRVDQETQHLAAEADRVIEGDFQGLYAIRTDAERMLLQLRDLFAREADLLYEQFNEPGALD